MIRITFRYVLILGLAAVVWLWNGDVRLTSSDDLVATAEALRGRPVTPVSYAGVARRSTVGAGAPGVGARPANRGGPVNRVGRR